MRTFAFRLVWLTVGVLAFVASEPPHDPALARRVTKEVAQGPDTTLDLDRIAPFVWDRVCTFPPYSGWKGASYTLGHPWLYRWSSELANYEHLTYLVFLDGYRVAGAAELGGGNGDFAYIGHACVARGDAAFTVTEPPARRPRPIGRTVYHVRLER